MGNSRSEGLRGWLAGLTGAKRPWLPIPVDSEGEASGLDRIAASAGKGPHDICLILPPGMVLLRKVEAPGLDHKALEASLLLKAEESLPAGLEEYCLDTWSIDDQAMGLAALPVEPLRRARREIGRRLGPITRIRVPELLPPDRGTGLAIWSTRSGLTVCRWEANRLCEWHIFPKGMPTETLGNLISAVCPTSPAWAAFDESASAAADLQQAVHHAWPNARILSLAEKKQDWSAPPSSGSAFESFLREEARQPASTAQKLRLALMVSGAVVAGLFFLFSEVGYLQRRTAQLSHQVSLLKVQANRSGQVASRIGDALQELNELKALTVERRGILYLLQALSNALPGQVKLVGLSVERSGSVSMEGLARSELDITLLLDELGRSSMFDEPRLTFTQKETGTQADSSGAMLRFRVETRLRGPLVRLPKAPDEA